MSSSTLKAVFDTEIRRLTVDMTSKDLFADLLADLSKKFELPSNVMEIRYQDDEQELVTIKSTEELLEAFATAKQDNKTLKVYVHRMDADPATAAGGALASSTSSMIVPLTSEALKSLEESSAKSQDASRAPVIEAPKLEDQDPLDASQSDMDSFVEVEAPEDSTDMLRANLEDVDPSKKETKETKEQEQIKPSPQPSEADVLSIAGTEEVQMLDAMDRRFAELGLDMDVATEDDDDSVFSYAITIKSAAANDEQPLNAPPPSDSPVVESSASVHTEVEQPLNASAPAFAESPDPVRTVTKDEQPRHAPPPLESAVVDSPDSVHTEEVHVEMKVTVVGDESASNDFKFPAASGDVQETKSDSKDATPESVEVDSAENVSSVKVSVESEDISPVTVEAVDLPLEQSKAVETKSEVETKPDQVAADSKNAADATDQAATPAVPAPAAQPLLPKPVDDDDVNSLPSMELFTWMVVDLLSQRPLRGALEEACSEACRMLESGRSNLLQILSTVLDHQPELGSSALAIRIRPFIPSLLVAANKVFKVSRRQTVSFLKTDLPSYLKALDAGKALDVSAAPLDFVFGQKCLAKLRRKWAHDFKKKNGCKQPVADVAEKIPPTVVEEKVIEQVHTTQEAKAKLETLKSSELQWIAIAREGEEIELPPDTLVRYGAGNRWIERVVGGMIQVSNEMFTDPAPSVVKHLEMALHPDEPKPTQPVAQASTEAKSDSACKEDSFNTHERLHQEPMGDPVVEPVKPEKPVEPAVEAVKPVVKPAPEEARVIHDGVQCDGCGVIPIVGVRYKCIECHDYDLCETCELSGKVHSPLHVMYKVKVPTDTFPYEPSRFPAPQRVEEKSQPRTSGLQAKFVAHANMPNNTEVAAGSTVTKSWKVQNSGATVWPHGVQLACVSGEVLPFGDASERIPLPRAAPGETVVVSLRVAIPAKAGRFCGNYKLETSAGVRFGERIWLVVNAVEPYEHQAGLNALMQMGFNDKALNKSMLDKFKGNLEEAVAAIVRQQS